MTHQNGAVTRDHFDALKTRRYSHVDIEGLGRVYFRSLTEKERYDIHEQMLEKEKTTLSERSYIVCAAVTDADGNRLFMDSEVGHIKEMDSGVIEQIYSAIDNLCHVAVSRESERLEETAKNLPSDGAEDSPSS